MTRRVERDALGEVRVPADALWGAQTQRAIENFPISGQRFGRRFLAALGHVKRAAAQANAELGRLDDRRARAILRACDEVILGELDAHFPVDVFQTGSGTSTNMNANEVLARRAMQLAPEAGPIHPNDHVNASQSSNDVIPTAIHIAVTLALRDALLPALDTLRAALEERAIAFDDVVKSGRTHLQDAAPVRMGQVFGGYATQIAQSRERGARAVDALREVALGGTAVGTGLNCPPDFPRRALAHLNAALGTDFAEAADHIAANAARDALVEVSGTLKVMAVSVHKVANDLRWLGSGPRDGLGELRLPAVQPGSSIMPGKVNPVIPEAVLMVCAQVIGYDVANTLGGLGGHFELNLMMPLLAHNLLTGTEMLANATRLLAERCVTELEVDRARCQAGVERNLALATALAPAIGHDRAAAIAQEAERTGQTVREVAQAQGALSPEELARLLDPRRMTFDA